MFQAQETEKQENLKKKLEIIDKIKALVTKAEDLLNAEKSEFFAYT